MTRNYLTSLWLAVSLLACSASDTSTTPMSPDQPAVAYVSLTPAGAISMPSTTTLPLRATVYDATHQIITAALVTYLSSDSAIAVVDSSGLLRAKGPTGMAFITAMVGHITSSPDTVTVVAGGPALVDKVGPSPTVVIAGSTFGDSARVVVTDVGGNAVPNVAVNFAITSGDGRIAPSTVMTDSHGAAATQFTTGSVAGPNSATATVGRLMPDTFSVVTASGTASLALSSSVATGTQFATPDTASQAPPNTYWVGLECPSPQLLSVSGDPVDSISVSAWVWNTDITATYLPTKPAVPPRGPEYFLQPGPLAPGQGSPLWLGMQVLNLSAPLSATTRVPVSAIFRVRYRVSTTGQFATVDLDWQCQ